jgi:hypothetical protein
MLRLGIIKSFEKAVNNMIPQNMRAGFWPKSRCDSQSSCAEKARELIKIIIHDIELLRKPTSVVTPSKNNGEEEDDGLDNNDLCYDDCQYGKQIPFISKKCRQDIFTFLDKCSDGRGGENDCYLSRHKCSVIALMTIEEALIQVQVGMAYDLHIQEQLVKVFEGLHLHLSNKSNFSSTIDTPRIAERLELKKLQYSGRGMEYLKLLSKNQRNKNNNNSLN